LWWTLKRNRGCYGEIEMVINVEGIVVESDVSNEEVGEESELDAVNSYLAVGP